MFKEKLNYKLLNILILCGIIYFALLTSNYWMKLVLKVVSILTPFALAFCISYALYPIVKKLKDKGLSNKAAVAIVTIVILLIIALILAITIPLLYSQLIVLSQSIGQIITDLSSKFAINLGDFKSTVQGILNGLIESLGNNVTSGIGGFISNSIGFLSNGVIVLILSIYFLADMSKIRKDFKKLLLRNKKHKKFYEYIKTVDKELGQYLYGLITFMCIELVEYSLLFLIIGHPNWLLLGILACICTIIPYFGGLATNIIAVVLASVKNFPLFIATLVVCLIFPNIDGYVISPRVYGKTNNINPMWTIFAVVVGGALFGVPGIAVALPSYIIIRCTINFFKEDIKDKLEDIKDNN